MDMYLYMPCAVLVTSWKLFLRELIIPDSIMYAIFLHNSLICLFLTFKHIASSVFYSELHIKF